MAPSTPTIERLLDSAELLFADRGVRQTSLRAVTQEAGANLAAVNYHFGSKQGLLLAVLDRRVVPMNDERIAMLAAADAKAGPGGPTLEAVMEAFLAPAVKLGQGDGRHFFALAARLHSEPDESLRREFLDRFEEVAARFLPALQRCLPDVPMSELFWRVHFIVGALCHVVGNCLLLQDFSKGMCRANDDEALPRLIAFAVAGMRAPAPPVESGAA
jgi:AcrR family transcriptional regulator